MTSQSGQLISSPSWGAALRRREERRREARAVAAVRLPAGASALDVAAGLVVLAAPFALWAAFVAAVW